MTGPIRVLPAFRICPSRNEGQREEKEKEERRRRGEESGVFLILSRPISRFPPSFSRHFHVVRCCTMLTWLWAAGRRAGRGARRAAPTVLYLLVFYAVLAGFFVALLEVYYAIR